MKRQSAGRGSDSWRRVIASGALWAVVYNLVWGSAWFLFMRREWLEAVAALGRPLPWTAEVWLVWVILTVPLGVAIMAHAEGLSLPPWKGPLAPVAVWLLLASGMTVWGIHESLSMRVLALDAFVNFVAIIVAWLVGAWSLGPAELGPARAGSRAL